MPLRRASISPFSFRARAVWVRQPVFLGFNAKRWDTRYGNRYDLTVRANLRRILHDVRKLLILAACLAPPCTSLSTARHRTNVIRSRREPWGVSSPVKPFSANDWHSLVTGNATCSACIKLVCWLHKAHIPWCVENPAGSLLWHLPFFAALAQDSRVLSVLVDHCSYGRPWRKRTRLLFGNVDPCDVQAFERRVCCGRQVCSFTGRPHVQLTGTGHDGIPMTLRAHNFLHNMSRDIARVLLSHAIHERTRFFFFIFTLRLSFAVLFRIRKRTANESLRVNMKKKKRVLSCMACDRSTRAISRDML